MLTATIDGKSKTDILREIRAIKTGERHLFFSNGVVSAIDVLRALIRLGDSQIDIMIATWQLGIRDAGNLKLLAQKDNINLRILLDVSYKDRNPQYFERVKNSLGGKIWLTSNHTKVMTIGIEDKSFVVLSSANFNRNFRFEFFDITESKELYKRVLDNYEPLFQGKPIGIDGNDRPVVKDRFKAVFDRENEKIQVNFEEDIFGDIMSPTADFDFPELDITCA